MKKEVNLLNSESEVVEDEVGELFPLDQLPDQELFRLKRIIEAILFATPSPIPLAKIRDALSTVLEMKPKEVKKLLTELGEEYDAEERAFCLAEIGDGFVLRTRPSYSSYLDLVFCNKKIEKLSPSATEVLAIIAFRQPITRPEIEEIRGIDSSGVVVSLTERGLIEIVGKKDVPGRPSLYGTTPLFLEHYGLKDVKELPAIHRMPLKKARIGQADEDVEEPVEVSSAEAIGDEPQALPEPAQD